MLTGSHSRGPQSANGPTTSAANDMHEYLRGLRPYYRHVLGTIVIGSVCGLIMNTAVVLPAILLGRAIDTVRALAAGTAPASAVGWAALAYLGGVLLMESA